MTSWNLNVWRIKKGGKRVEALRVKLHKYISLYGQLDPRTIKVSQQLDKLIVKSMKGVKA